MEPIDSAVVVPVGELLDGLVAGTYETSMLTEPERVGDELADGARTAVVCQIPERQVLRPVRSEHDGWVFWKDRRRQLVAGT